MRFFILDFFALGEVNLLLSPLPASKHGKPPYQNLKKKINRRICPVFRQICIRSAWGRVQHPANPEGCLARHEAVFVDEQIYGAARERKGDTAIPAE